MAVLTSLRTSPEVAATTTPTATETTNTGSIPVVREVVTARAHSADHAEFVIGRINSHSYTESALDGDVYLSFGDREGRAASSEVSRRVGAKRG